MDTILVSILNARAKRAVAWPSTAAVVHSRRRSANQSLISAMTSMRKMSRARRPLSRREPSFNRSQLRKSSSAAQTPQVTEDQQLIDSSAYSSRKLLILRALGAGSPGWIRTSVPPVNSVVLQIALASLHDEGDKVRHRQPNLITDGGASDTRRGAHLARVPFVGLLPPDMVSFPALDKDRLAVRIGQSTTDVRSSRGAS